MSNKSFYIIVAIIVLFIIGWFASNIISAKRIQDEIKLLKSTDGTIEIKEKIFVAQTKDVFTNTTDYIGRTIKLQGLFKLTISESTSSISYHVIRYGPGCCDDDETLGFEVIWDQEYPEIDDWVEVIGVLEYYFVDGYKIIRLRLLELNVLTERGNEYVKK